VHADSEDFASESYTIPCPVGVSRVNLGHERMTSGDDLPKNHFIALCPPRVREGHPSRIGSALFVPFAAPQGASTGVPVECVPEHPCTQSSASACTRSTLAAPELLV
jgi:hypothetical protein